MLFSYLLTLVLLVPTVLAADWLIDNGRWLMCRALVAIGWRRGRHSKGVRSPRLQRLVLDLEFWADLWLDRLANHETAVRLGFIDRECADKAPGWWDLEFDCNGHNCRRCDLCRLEALDTASFLH